MTSRYYWVKECQKQSDTHYIILFSHVSSTNNHDIQNIIINYFEQNNMLDVLEKWNKNEVIVEYIFEV